MKKLIYITALILAIAFFSCSKDKQTDEEKIQEYLTQNNITAVRHESGLYYVIKTEGTGANPNANNTVTVHYKGFLTNGQQFDGTTTSPATFKLSGLIPGWQIGIPLIKKGGDITLILPSVLGYGTQGVGSIPRNSVLVFDIQLLDVK